jgi:hypothetical protein
MSKREIRRIEVLSEVMSGRRTLAAAAGVMAATPRHARLLLLRLQAGGGTALAHKTRGRPSNNKIAVGVRDYVLALVQERYADFGPMLAAEMLAQHHGLTVSRESLRQWMVEAGLWLSRQQRRSFHQPRLRREARGELVQIDSSEHRWFEDRGDPCALLVFIDDATGKPMQLDGAACNTWEALLSSVVRAGRGKSNGFHQFNTLSATPTATLCVRWWQRRRAGFGRRTRQLTSRPRWWTTGSFGASVTKHGHSRPAAEFCRKRPLAAALSVSAP